MSDEDEGRSDGQDIQLRAVPSNAEVPATVPAEAGFGSGEGFALLQRMGQLLMASQLVPKVYQKNLPNTVIALEISKRIGASPLAVMQSLDIIHGKPSWSSQFIIAAINNTRKFSPLRFLLTEPEPEREVTAELTEYEDGQKRVRKIAEKIRNRECTAWAIEKATGERLESPPVSIEMAVKEGWYSKKGSKWQTMSGLMLRYRSATFFGRLYAPEILMGMVTVDEAIDITPEPEPAAATAEAVRSASERRQQELKEQYAKDHTKEKEKPKEEKPADAPEPGTGG